MKITITNEDSNNVEIAISYDDRSVETFDINSEIGLLGHSFHKGVGKAHVNRDVFPDYVANLYNSQKDGTGDNDLTNVTFMYTNANDETSLKTISLAHLEFVSNRGFTARDDNGMCRTYLFDRISTDPVIG